MFWVFLLVFMVFGGTGLKILGDLTAIKNGTYAKRKAKQLLWKSVRRRK